MSSSHATSRIADSNEWRRHSSRYLSILEGRHRRLQEKAEMLRVELERSPSGIDKYLEEWRRHSLESAMREIAWLEDMIKTERK